ncbi:MAG: outer membrane protein assembly factor BamC [Burkholderiales bacterium]|nr:outer membrane protein assembly factor BamC [Burkholderiales bacterium]
METCRVTLPLNFRLATVAALASLSALSGCSSVEGLFTGDKVDYRSSSTRSTGLDVPPDLTQLAKDTRYQPSSGVISASTFQAAPATASPAAPGTATAVAAVPSPAAPVAAVATTGMIAPVAVGSFKMERLGNDRWLSTTLTPEQVFPQVRAFWKDNGFNLAQDRPEAGVIETEWAENRAKLPNDFVRRSLGRVFENAYSTSELDKFRTRVERTPTGSDIYVSHRGMEEKYIGERKESTIWQPRPVDPSLEAEFLSRLMVKLGAKDEEAKAVVAAAAPPTPGAPVPPAVPARARMLPDRPGPTLQVDDGFDRAWRRVGLALDRSGFTVEDRDRAQGVYFVRYVDPSFAGREEPNFFAKLFSFGKKDDGSGLAKYRVKITAEGTSSTVAVLDSTGKPELGEAGKRISALLLDDLK